MSFGVALSVVFGGRAAEFSLVLRLPCYHVQDRHDDDTADHSDRDYPPDELFECFLFDESFHFLNDSMLFFLGTGVILFVSKMNRHTEPQCFVA